MDDQIIDGQLAEEGEPIAQNSGDGKASILLNMDSMIKSHMSSIDKLEAELDERKSMLQAIFDNDPTYKEHEALAKEAAKVKNATKQQILKQPQAAQLADKVKTIKSELKELKGALSDYLKEYQRMTGVNEIEGSDGEVREIVQTAKLIRKFSR